MNGLILIIPVAAIAFVATNIDNLALLVVFLFRYRCHRVVVGAAYLVGLLLMGLLSVLLGLLASVVPIQFLGLLGLVPISIGAVGIFRLSRGPVLEDEISQEQLASTAAVFAATLLTQLGNGADTVLTFGALFADSLRAASLMIMFTIAVMGVLFLYVANYFVRNPLLGDLMQRHAHRVTPFVLIFVGLYILANTASDLVPD